MNKKEYIEAANKEPRIKIYGKKSNRNFSIREFTYGVLVPDYDHPLSCVSVANSSLSIDLWVGCKWQCAYCQVQGSNQDLANNGAMPLTPQRRNRFTVDEIADALIDHPFFLKNETIISIGTASTEPFAPGPVLESTFAIMEAFLKRKIKNPFWIVTKAGIPKGRKLDFAKIVNATKGLMISLCWAGNPMHIEPMKNNRFVNAKEAKEAGVTLTWYLRPLSEEWSGDQEQIERMMLWVKEHYGSLISAIVPGGLRWTEGIEYGLTEVHEKSLPEMEKLDNEKDLSEKLAQIILKLAQLHLPDIPVYFKSSCAITRMLKVPSISSVQVLSRNECELSLCPFEQRQRCANGKVCYSEISDIQKTIDRLGVPTTVVKFDVQESKVVTDPPLENFTYALRQIVINNLSVTK